MRNGRLLIEKKKSIKAGDICYSTQFDGMIKVPDAWATEDLDPDRLFELRIEDEMTKEVFRVFPEQATYLMKSENKDRLRFYDINNELSGFKEAVVLAKNNQMTDRTKFIAPVADAYGQYVARQKSQNEPAKNFNLWYFEISI